MIIDFTGSLLKFQRTYIFYGISFYSYSWCIICVLSLCFLRHSRKTCEYIYFFTSSSSIVESTQYGHCWQHK
ncbi:Os09g0498000 [Oryza sativa Japonica Group]|uniref:Os09g0498000 protein n=1 Tax=Oryza sativa subsp. japonica TaxID=39947 RepID=B7F666_ORYSJ|nr:hypothetical protein EE612_048728 [Oryza sativa]KAF2916874.1 hypothetical protein DAI22_09g152100 [Oryza sativa Japonica Group]BAH00114.1 unnamed protein product [Oryza sativa Japonica Group]BAT08789.1 Os09g0498000 [Oryza sativa Japonica Group]